jgi:hypothetical protein
MLRFSLFLEKNKDDILGFENHHFTLLRNTGIDKTSHVELFSLTAADYVFILDPWWNPVVEKQALSRAHRIGQKRNVFSCKFITGDTVEEKILNLKLKKSELATEFINTSNPFNYLPTSR